MIIHYNKCVTTPQVFCFASEGKSRTLPPKFQTLAGVGSIKIFVQVGVAF